VYKGLTIETAYPHIGAHPDVTLAILKNGIDVIGKKPLVDLVVFGKRLLCMAKKPHTNQEGKQKECTRHADGEDKRFAWHHRCTG
jgi:hypothetical protein